MTLPDGLGTPMSVGILLVGLKVGSDRLAYCRIEIHHDTCGIRS